MSAFGALGGRFWVQVQLQRSSAAGRQLLAKTEQWGLVAGRREKMRLALNFLKARRVRTFIRATAAN